MPSPLDPLAALKIYRDLPMAHHLHVDDGGPTISIADTLLLKQLADDAQEQERMQRQGVERPKLVENFRLLSTETICGIHEHYGEGGLFRLHFLASMCSNQRNFEHFLELIRVDLLFQNLRTGARRTRLNPDNRKLPSGPELKRFNHNVLDARVSRKLFNPGYREGTLIYGLGGPRILVSLPFVGATKFYYDCFGHSSDVITSLMLDGYHGTFFFLDSVEGLNKDFYGHPGWLLWFSFVSAHSDLILFVKIEDQDLSDAQKLEVAFTPDRVPKKIVEIRRGELTKAKSDGFDPAMEIFHFIEGEGFVPEQQFNVATRRFAEPHVRNYLRTSISSEHLVVYNERGWTEQPIPAVESTLEGASWPKTVLNWLGHGN